MINYGLFISSTSSLPRVANAPIVATDKYRLFQCQLQIHGLITVSLPFAPSVTLDIHLPGHLGRQKEASGASTQDEPLPPTEITSPPKHPQQVLVCQLHKGAVFPFSVCSLNLASPPKMAQCFLLSLTRNPITRNGKQACPEWCLLSS